MGYAYNRGICGEKNWAAVRREERRELPQPVVISIVLRIKKKQVRSAVLILRIFYLFFAVCF